MFFVQVYVYVHVLEYVYEYWSALTSGTNSSSEALGHGSFPGSPIGGTQKFEEARGGMPIL